MGPERSETDKVVSGSPHKQPPEGRHSRTCFHSSKKCLQRRSVLLPDTGHPNTDDTFTGVKEVVTSEFMGECFETYLADVGIYETTSASNHAKYLHFALKFSCNVRVIHYRRSRFCAQEDTSSEII